MTSKKHRSPPYPGISLQDALERAKTFFKKEGKHETLVTTALAHWGYSSKSSGGLIAIAALKAYGLMGDKGGGSDRKVFLTPFGLRIVMDERVVSPDREEAIREAALTPKIMAELWEKYGLDLPSEDTIKHFLYVEKGYTEGAARDIIKLYVQNLEFAKIQQAPASDDAEGESDGDSEPAAGAPPLTPGHATPAPNPNIVRPSVVAAVPVGGEEIGNYRVSKNTTIRLVSSGPYTRQSIESLVKQLQLAIELGNFDDLEELDEG
jgi:hypothetical protein